MSIGLARAWFGATALLVLIALVMQFVVILTGPGVVNPNSSSSVARAINMFAYFTILSNTIVGVTSFLLFLNPHRASTVFCVFRLVGLVAITVTFLVYGVALAHLLDLDSWAYVSDLLLHRIIPVVAAIGWLVFGPRGMTSPRIAALTMLYPAGYMAFALIRGAIDKWYPYPFADVNALGYAGVIVNGFWIAILFFALAMGANALDKILPRRGPEASPSAAA